MMPLTVPKNLNLSFFNTETRKKQYLQPIVPKKISMYTCGPTVYNYAHIGNFRTYIFEDLLRKTLKLFDYSVHQVMNLTDVDDKTIKGAIAKNQSLHTYTQLYKDAFFEDLKTLNIEPCEAYPAATDFIPDMILFIEHLLDKGFAYVGSDDSIYFSIAKFPRYGCLSHLNMDELQVGASNRVAHDEYDKDAASDFVLWKAYDAERDGPIYWDSPFGKGRPGWHIECSTMAMKLLGSTIDIHVGGVDNIFPHHENEIAQSEGLTGKSFANLWMHAEHLIVDGKKMSKSYGNFFTLRDLLEKGFSARSIRFLLLQTHYKTQLNFTLESLKAANHTLERIDAFIERVQEQTAERISYPIEEEINTSFLEFASQLADDLNIAAALASLFDFIRKVNTLIDQKLIGHRESTLIMDYMRHIDTILGVMKFDRETAAIPQDLLKLLDQREIARKEKNWSRADLLRDEIASCGFQIVDTPQGPSLKKL